MSTQHIETLVIGAGQAGLAMGHQLQQQGREFLIVDAAARIGDNWRCHYDSLRLFTPAKYDGLAGLAFPGDPRHFPTKDEFADYLELYALTHQLPVRMSTPVTRLSAGPGDGYVVAVGGDEISCDNVVISTGTFGRTPHVPDLAGQLDPGVQQLHSSEYTRPSQLVDGPVLVVGASHSGLDIAYELADSRQTTLVGPERGKIPFEWGSRGLERAFPVIEFVFHHVLTRRTPMGRKAMRQVRHHGVPQLRVKRHHLQERNAEWITDHITSVVDGKPVTGGGRALDPAAVVWATGFRQDHDWIDLPLPVKDGWPVEYRGVVDSLPGLYFCGLAFQYCFGSGEMSGVDRDAKYVARRIADRAPVPPRPRVAA